MPSLLMDDDYALRFGLEIQRSALNVVTVELYVEAGNPSLAPGIEWFSLLKRSYFLRVRRSC
jgi:hypothetical protein